MSDFAFAVIGAGYGDEGKGLVTDYLASRLRNCVVIRSNGGAQAGHTVDCPTYGRHVFSHFSSGTYSGAATHLSKYFIINPILMEQEGKELKIQPHTVTVDPRAIVSTVWDMAVNQILAWVNKKQNTCGVGINETLKRSQIYNISINDMIINSKSKNKKIFAKARDVSLERLKIHHGISLQSVPHYFSDIFISDMILNSMTDTFDRVLEKYISIKRDEYIPSMYSNIIFEAAQGLMLDQNHKNYPFVTPSNTGSTNIKILIDDMKLSGVKNYYVSRCYETRHGEGPFPTESSNFMATDRTNKPNKFQGTLRIGKLDLNRLIYETTKDTKKAANIIENTLVITCMDQIKEEVPIYNIPNRRKYWLIEQLKRITNFDRVLYSYGSTRERIVSTKMAEYIEY